MDKGSCARSTEGSTSLGQTLLCARHRHADHLCRESWRSKLPMHHACMQRTSSLAVSWQRFWHHLLIPLEVKLHRLEHQACIYFQRTLNNMYTWHLQCGLHHCICSVLPAVGVHRADIGVDIALSKMGSSFLFMQVANPTGYWLFLLPARPENSSQKAQTYANTAEAGSLPNILGRQKVITSKY